RVGRLPPRALRWSGMRWSLSLCECASTPPFAPRHGVLANEEDPVEATIGKIVVGRCRLALDQFRARMNIVDRQAAAAVVSVPNHHFGRAGRERAFHGGV